MTLPRASRRTRQRCLIDLPLTLWEPASRRLLDDRAIAHDVTALGFGFETRAEIDGLSRILFRLNLPDGHTACGTARLIWTRRGDWGAWSGAHVVNMPAADRRKIEHLAGGSAPRYDWIAFWDRALLAAAVIVIGLLIQEFVRSCAR